MDRVRSFVAVLLDGSTRAALAARVEQLRTTVDGVAWIAPDNLHITVKFLGNVDLPRLPLVQAALERATAGAASFDLVVAGLGAFPSVSRARVLWAGVAAGGPALGAIAARVDRELAGVGFAPEERAFSAHVTLGRVREPKRNARLGDALVGGEFGTVHVDRLALMRSDLSSRGARYSELSSHRLS